MAKKKTDIKPPATLSGAAREHWKRLASFVDLSTPFAIDALAQYCGQAELYDVATAEVNRHIAERGTTLLEQPNKTAGEHPAINTAKVASVQMRLLRERMTIADTAKDSWD